MMPISLKKAGSFWTAVLQTVGRQISRGVSVSLSETLGIQGFNSNFPEK